MINAKGIECFWRGEEGGQQGFASLDGFAWEKLFFIPRKGERLERGQVRRERRPPEHPGAPGGPAPVLPLPPVAAPRAGL